MKHTFAVKWSVVVISIAIAGDSWASLLPGSVEPSQVSQALTRQSQPAATPEVAAPTLPKEESPPGLTKEAEKIKFKLNKIILEGNTIYSDAQLRPLYQNDLHKTITVAHLFVIVQRITNYYRNNGYILSRAILAPQHVKGGVVKVKIIEGYINKVEVSGHPHGAKCLVQRIGNKIAECRPLEYSRLAKYLLIENEIPGTQVKVVLAPAKKGVGAAEATLVAENRPLTGMLSYDNYGTRYLGPQQMTAGLGFNSWLLSGDSTQATVIKTPKGGELTYIDLNYNVPTDLEGSRWIMGGTRVHTHPLFFLREAQIDGLNNNYYMNWNVPIIRTRQESMTLRLGVNYLDSEVTALDFQLYNDHIRSGDLGISYTFADRWNGANSISSDLRQGLPILGYSSNTNPVTAPTSRPGGHADYTKVTLSANRLQSIYGPWSLSMAVAGQWAFNPLLTAEQFTFGGSVMGRGYDPAEILGDRGAAGSLELHYDWLIGKTFLNNLQLYTFYDLGKIWDIKVIPNLPRQQSASAAGFGVRFAASSVLSGNFMWAQPLTKSVAAEQLIHEGYRPRMFFSVVASF